MKSACPEALFKEIAINRLGRDCAVTRGDDHLAVGGSDATGGVEAWDTGALAFVHDDLALFIQGGAELPGEMVVEYISARGEETVREELLPAGEREAFQITGLVLDVYYFFDVNWHLVVAEPALVLRVPMRHFAIRQKNDGIAEGDDTERVFHRFVIVAGDGYAFTLNAIAIAIFAEKEALADAFVHSRDFWRKMINASGQEQTVAFKFRTLPF